MPRPPSLLLPPNEGGRPNGLFKTPPLIREQGPSAPSSPTTPGGRKRFLSPLNIDSMNRVNLLTTAYAHDFTKLSPISPSSYPTSDLGSSPRSSISITTSTLSPWSCYRDQNKSSFSFDLDDGSSDVSSKDLLSPGLMFSPAPYSPFSDCEGSETPFSAFARSPTLSPNPITGMFNHFSFDSVRSSSSMSGHNMNLLDPACRMASLDIESRGRSRSDSDMSPKDECMDTSMLSTISVPATTSRSAPGSFKKRLLVQYQEEQAQTKAKRSSSSPPPSCTGSEVDELDLRSISRVSDRPPSPCRSAHSRNDNDILNPISIGRMEHEASTATIPPSVIHQPQIVTALPTLTPELAAVVAAAAASATPLDLTLKNTLPLETIPHWIESQMLACLQTALLQSTPNAHIIAHAGSQSNRAFSLLKNSGLSTPLTRATTATRTTEVGPIKGNTLWRRSQSETDVSRTQQPIAHNFANGVYACPKCGAGFSCHDRLAKHIASRHRDRSATAAQEEEAKIHKCSQCTKKFTRSDMLTRHMRLHTGAKPYECQVCGQVFSRSDHLSTHQRTHTGEKPYQCSKCPYTASRRDMITRHFRTHDLKEDIPLGQLSLSPSETIAPIQPVPMLPTSPRATSPYVPSLLPTLANAAFYGSNRNLESAGQSVAGLTLGSSGLSSGVASAGPPSPSFLGSGEKSAFQPAAPSMNSRLLAPPTLIHSLSVPSSPIFSRQSNLSAPNITRQASIGL